MAKGNIQYYIEKLPRPLRNKFTVAIGIFVLWMTFFDQNSLINQLRLQGTLQELRDKRTYFQAEIKRDTEKQAELSTDDKNLEKFGREEHLMKKEDEDIFIITIKKE